MKISDLIKKLDEIKNASGDLKVIMLTTTPDGLFHIEHNPIIEDGCFPINANDENDLTNVCMVSWSDIFEYDNDPNLKIVK